MLALVLALTPASLASADIEFKSSGPVTIFVDGRQAAQSNPLKHRMSGLESGVHELRVVGMFGKTLYEAEIDLPDNTVTYTSWERGEIKVLSTDWLPKEEAIVADEPSDTGLVIADEQLVAEAPPPVEPESGVSPAAAAAGGAAVGAGVAVAATNEPEPVEELAVEPTAVEPEPPVEDAVAAVEPATASAVEPAGASGAGAAPVVVAAAAVPVAAAATTAAATPPKPRTLTLQATEGMRIEVVQDGRKVILVYENGLFRIEDETGFSMVLGN